MKTLIILPLIIVLGAIGWVIEKIGHLLLDLSFYIGKVISFLIEWR